MPPPQVAGCAVLCGEVMESSPFLGTAHKRFKQTPLSAQQFVVLIKGQPVPKIQTGPKTSQSVQQPTIEEAFRAVFEAGIASDLDVEKPGKNFRKRNEDRNSSG